MKYNFEENHLLHSIIETATDGIIVIDDQGRIEMVNIAAEKLFDNHRSELIGNNINKLMPNPYKSEHDGYIQKYRNTGIKKIIGIGRDVIGQKKDGRTFPFRLSVSEVLFNGKRLFAGIVHDLTEKKIAEERLKSLNAELESRVEERTKELEAAINKLLEINKKLEVEVKERKSAENALRISEKELQQALTKEKELNELKSRFVSMASHEFRTPLSTILSSADILEEYKEKEQQPNREKHTLRIKSAVNNLTNILNDFLSLNKLEEGKVKAKPILFYINSFSIETFDELQGVLKKGQKINYIGLKEDLEIKLDSKLLKNVYYNLLSNAIKYSKEEQPITCKVELSESRLQISIKDEGIGIPIDEQQHLFTRFFRARNVESIQGTGLGLAIVRNYVTMMDGDIWFESKEGKGSTFYVSIPLK